MRKTAILGTECGRVCSSVAAACEGYAGAECGAIGGEPSTALDDLILSACRRYYVRPADVMGRGRSQALSRARQLVWFELRAQGLSYPDIGRMFGRDHTSVMVGVEAHARRLRGDDTPRKAWAAPYARYDAIERRRA